MRREELQSDGPTKLCAFGLPHDAHAALAELLEDLVMTDRSSNHLAETVLLGVLSGSEA